MWTLKSIRVFGFLQNVDMYIRNMWFIIIAVIPKIKYTKLCRVVLEKVDKAFNSPKSGMLVLYSAGYLLRWFALWGETVAASWWRRKSFGECNVHCSWTLNFGGHFHVMFYCKMFIITIIQLMPYTAENKEK